MTEPLLEVAALYKHFPLRKTRGPKDWFSKAKPVSNVHAVVDVSFVINPGETIGLVGESGCGKSTLVRVLTRLLDPTDGMIRFAGEDIGRLPARKFGSLPQRKLIQMVFQDAGESINPRFTSFDAIADPLRRLRPELNGQALIDRVNDLADLTGLPRTLLSRFPHQLSGGQKARVGIARAIAVEPKLLILDEPTAALDVSVQVVILQLLQSLKERLGMSYLFVSHDLHVVHLLCDRVLVMYLGKIVESGPADALFHHPAHPYTKALVSAVPTFEPGLSTTRLRITGEPASPIDPSPTRCRFVGRCPKSAGLCETQMPLLAPVGDGGHIAACHFPEVRA